jgi:type IV pilus assembly protein PilC
MITFSYEATNASNVAVSGTVEATNREAAIEALSKQGLRPLLLAEKKEGQNLDSILQRFGGGKVKTESLVIFTRQLATMVGAGVPLLRSLNSLKANKDKILEKAVTQVADDVQSGLNLADALERHPATFNEIYVNMVRAGESAGILDEILNRLALQQEKSATIKKKVKGAMTYPMILLFITTGAFFGLMLFVIPQIGKILTDLGGEDAKLPPLTQAMLGISSFLTSYWFIIIPAIIGGIFMLRRFISTPKGKRAFHAFLLKAPVIKNIIIKIAIARFARTFASLMGAGVSVVESLQVTSGAIGNEMYKDALAESVEGIKNGKQLSETLQNNPLFPDIVSQMLAVGEETGKTDTVLIKVADFYEEEVDVVLDSLGSIIEPVMIVFMGGMVGIIAASVMQPIASLSQNIKN